MRVVYVSTLERGGPVSHLLDLAPRVAARGADVRVVCVNDAVAARFREAGVDAVAVDAPVSSKWDVRGAFGLWPLVAGADVVHTQDRRAGLFGRVFAKARRAGAIVHTYHGLPEEIAVELGRERGFRDPSVSPLRRAWLRGGYLRIEAMLARLGVVVVPSEAMAAYLAGAGVPRARLRVIPSGVEVVRREPPAVRHDPPVIAALANLEPWKGVDVLIDACALVARERPVHLDVYGDGDERQHLEARASRLGIDARFHGHVPGARERLLDVDVVVVPSRAENLPVTALEAMAAAVPVVAARVGGVAELVDDGVTGIIVPPDDPGAMAAAIGKIVTDDSVRVAMGRAGAARAAERFAPDDVARRLLEVYEEQCASSR